MYFGFAIGGLRAKDTATGKPELGQGEKGKRGKEGKDNHRGTETRRKPESWKAGNPAFRISGLLVFSVPPCLRGCISLFPASLLPLRNWLSGFLAFLLMGCLAGCGENVSVVAPGAGELIGEGWKEYVAGNYEDAIAKHQEALEKDSAAAEAYNGIGWARARLGQLSDSIDSFKKAVARDPANADAHAGLAGAYLADGDYERAIASARLVLSLKPEYASHHDDIKAADIRVLLAECYYNVGDYASAKAQIDLLGGSGRDLNPYSPTYQADLLSVIEGLAKKDS